MVNWLLAAVCFLVALVAACSVFGASPGVIVVFDVLLMAAGLAAAIALAIRGGP